MQLAGKGAQTVELLVEYYELLFKASQGQVKDNTLDTHLTKIEHSSRAAPYTFSTGSTEPGWDPGSVNENSDLLKASETGHAYEYSTEEMGSSC